MKKILSKLKDEKGQSLVEFALVLIVLLLISLGIIEFGWGWYRADTLKNAANIAARTYAVATVNKEDAAEAAADTVEAGMGNKVVFTCKNASGNIIDCNSNPASVTATVSEPFKTLVPGILPMLFNITELRRDATYRLE